jgi:hypothetical protein
MGTSVGVVTVVLLLQHTPQGAAGCEAQYGMAARACVTCDGGRQAAGRHHGGGAQQRAAGSPSRVQQARPRATGRREPPQLRDLRWRNAYRLS